MSTTHGTDPFEGMDTEELADTIIGVLLGDRDAQAKIADTALKVIYADLIEPARRHQVETGDTHPLHFGEKAKEYVRKTLSEGPGSASGLILALVEIVLRRDRELRAVMTRTTGTRTDLDFAAIEAERDDLRFRLEQANRETRSAWSDARTADRNLREANRTITELTEQLGQARERADRVPSLEATILRMDGDLIEANGLRQALEEKVAETKEASRS